MRNRLALIVTVLALTVITHATRSFGLTYSFQPTPKDLYDLDHEKYYTWGLNWTVPVNEEICGASLSFSKIANWDNNPNDLWVTLLDTTTVGVIVGTDNEGGGNKFAGQGVALVHYQNLTTTPINLTYVFTPAQVSALATYAADGKFGLGFDPDCHYFNDGITLRIDTCPKPAPQAVPEPATTALAGLGLGALTLKLTRRSKA